MSLPEPGAASPSLAGPAPALADAAPAASSRSTRGRIKVKPNSLLAARAATEYVYVGQDLRRIGLVAAGLLLALLTIWVLLVPLDLAGVY